MAVSSDEQIRSVNQEVDMPETNESVPHPVVEPSPGGRAMGAWGIAVVTLYLLAVTVLVFYGLIALWPPKPGSAPTEVEKQVTERLGKIEEALGLPKPPAVVPPGAPTPPASSAANPGATRPPAGNDLTSDLSETPAATELPLASDLTSALPGKEKEKEKENDSVGEPESQSVKFLWIDRSLSDEGRFFLIVIFAGALGGLVHAVRSFYWYAGCRKLVLSWTGFYITLPVLGAAMATVFYLVLRGGLFSPKSTIGEANPFGFAALAVLIGMFTEQAAAKLKQVFETLMAEAPKGTDQATSPVAPISVMAIAPLQGVKAGGEAVTIFGKGFAKDAKVTFGGVAATDVKVASGESLTAKTPATVTAGKVTVEVTNADGKKASLADAFTYV